MRVLNIAAAALLVSATAFAQDEVARKQAVEVAARVPLENTVKGAPYSGETIVENVQVLADGNRIVRKTTGKVYRDGEGRTRREDEQPLTTKTANGVVSVIMTTISIVDPVAGYSYSLDPEHKIAWRTPTGTVAAILDKLKLDRALAEKNAAAVQQRKEGSQDYPSTSAAAAEKEKVAAEKEKAAAAGGWIRRPEGAGGGGGGAPVSGEVMVRSRGNVAMAYMPEGPIEHKVLEGIAVEGRKTATTIPAGQVGNEQPLTIVSEEWRSPELNLLVLTRHSDPRIGDSSYRLTNIVRAEPDPSFFIVPPDYTVRDTGVRKMVEAPRR